MSGKGGTVPRCKAPSRRRPSFFGYCVTGGGAALRGASAPRWVFRRYRGAHYRELVRHEDAQSLLANQARRKGRGLPKDGLKEKRPKTWRRPVGLKPSARSMAGRCRRANFPTPARRRCYRSLLAGPRSKAPFIGCLSYRVFRSMFVVITRAEGLRLRPRFLFPGNGRPRAGLDGDSLSDLRFGGCRD
jgi:hypothetical protein